MSSRGRARRPTRENMLDPNSLKLGVDEYGTRIRIYTATLMGEQAYQVGFGKFTYTGETIASSTTEDVSTETVTDAAGERGHLVSGRSRHGRGEARYDTESHYNGMWSRGKREGYGEFVFACGDTYHGQWLAGKYHGKGRYTSVDSEGQALEYDGEWVRDKMEGQGRYIYKSSGDVYEGGFDNGFRVGFGKLTCANGDVYIGEYEMGELMSKTALDKAALAVGTNEAGLRIRLFTAHTSGEQALKAGLGQFKYTGETIASRDAVELTTEKVADAPGVDGHLANGRSRHGEGQIEYESGSFYSGQWVRGKREGHGKFVFACGDIYEGQWKAGKYHGEGTYSSSDSDSYSGQWAADMMHGVGTFTHAESGDVYVGGFANGLKEGKGKYTCVGGEVYEGEYRAGERVSVGGSKGGMSFINSPFTSKVEYEAWLQLPEAKRAAALPAAAGQR